MEPTRRPEPTTAAPAPATDWAALIRVSSEREAAEAPAPPKPKRAPKLVEPVDEVAAAHAESWDRVIAEAARLGPGLAGTLMWIDARCVLAGMHPLDVWWLGTLINFYATGKLVLVVRNGLRGAKSVSVCRALVNDAMFGRCNIDSGTPAVIPIMSADRTEATDRFHTIKAVLAACGMSNIKAKEEDSIVPAGGLGMTYESKTLPSGGGVITIRDCENRVVEFRVYPARLTGVIGHTDKAGFGDELDTWPVDELGVSDDDVAKRSSKGRANPADVVLDRWLERFTTTRKTAHLYLVSASYYGHNTAHARKVAEGDTSIQMVARLGALGAERDEVARLSLAGAIGSDDPRLLARSDPNSTDIPAWVTNPTATIADCYALSRDRLGPMFGRYGGRPDESEAWRGPFADTAFVIDERADRPQDVIVGVSPPNKDSAEWGIVAVSLSSNGGIVVLSDASASRIDALAAAGRVRALSFNLCGTCLAVPAEHARRVEAEIVAAYAGTGIVVPGVAPQFVLEPSGLLVGPTHTLYQRGTLRHAADLEDLAAALRAWTPEKRSPRVEALVSAVARLVGCYPWLKSAQMAAPVNPRAIESFNGVGDLRGMDLVRRLGGR